MNKELYSKFITNPEIKNDWPAAFLRDEVITDLLGDDVHSILYWAGKRMARKYATSNQNDLIVFFIQTGLGDLSIKNETNSLIELELTGPIVENRLAANDDADFMFEAGFLAQTAELQKGFTAEAEINKKQLKKGHVFISVHLDPKDPADDFNQFNHIDVIYDHPHPEAPTDEPDAESDSK
ncbi:YslB family protein [Lactobacillaceae bacterium Melli_B4]